jgi:hypothetical protein
VTGADESESPAYAAAIGKVQAAKAILILRIEYEPPKRHLGSIVGEQTAPQVLPRRHDPRVGRRYSQPAHRNSETGHSVHSPRNRIERMRANNKGPCKFSCRAY